MVDDDAKAMEASGVKVRKIRVLDGDGQTWITIDVMQWIGRPTADSLVPNEPTTGPPTG